MDDEKFDLNSTEEAPLEVSSKIKQLENIAAGHKVNIDSTALKSRLASFLVAHADKVMDTVAPLEQLREELSNEYITKAMELVDNEEATPASLYKAIDSIQQMNLYSINTLKSILDADKLSTFIAIDASDNSTRTQVNVLNLDNAQSRAKVTKAVAALQRLMSNSGNDVDGGSVK